MLQLNSRNLTEKQIQMNIIKKQNTNTLLIPIKGRTLVGRFKKQEKVGREYQ